MSQHDLFSLADEAPRDVICLLTYVGEQTKPVPSVHFAVCDEPERDFPPLPETVPLHANDRVVQPMRIACTEEQVLALAGAARGVAVRSLDGRPFLRFATATTAAWDEGFVDRDGARALLDALLGVFGDDHLEARRALTRLRGRVL